MLYYGLVCTAISEERQQLKEGMRQIAGYAHKYEIPITWAIVADDIQFHAKELTDWHNEYGDDFLLMIDIKSLWDSQWMNLTGISDEGVEEGNDISLQSHSSSPEIVAEHLVRMRETLPGYIRTQWKKVERSLDWANPSVVGAEWKNQVLIHAIEQEGFRGLWGYRWNERETLAENDRGCPFGFFYPSNEQHNFSAPTSGSIAAIPYDTVSHLVPEATNLRAALINDLYIQNFNIYVENEKWNSWLGYIQHINAIEVSQLGQESLDRLDVYFANVCENENTRVYPLSEMVDEYWSSCQQTEPTFLIVDTPDNVTPNELDQSESTLPEVNNSDDLKVKRTLFFYDSECQFTFNTGSMEPEEMKNYITPPVVENTGLGVSMEGTSMHGVEYHLPKVVGFRPTRKRSRLHLSFTIESTKAMPYGIAIWGNHLGLELASSNAKSVTWVDEYLLFIRLALQHGQNDFEIVLTI
ncbi:hypothetical protein C6497_13280 [Candidatus Poribacteria bacterium]|nr:MAG: hypothetical protein C6497_13280 [Candidatus Poribacteria bacterium]